MYLETSILCGVCCTLLLRLPFFTSTRDMCWSTLTLMSIVCYVIFLCGVSCSQFLPHKYTTHLTVVGMGIHCSHISSRGSPIGGIFDWQLHISACFKLHHSTGPRPFFPWIFTPRTEHDRDTLFCSVNYSSNEQYVPKNSPSACFTFP